jgi:hypothetical protein
MMLLISLLFALAAGQVTTLPVPGAYLAVQWDGPSPVAWPCGQDACWLVIAPSGVTTNVR